MAPEYIDKGVISNKQDIFSLGIIILEMITTHSRMGNLQSEERKKAIELVRRKKEAYFRLQMHLFFFLSIIRSYVALLTRCAQVLGKWRKRLQETSKGQSVEGYCQQVKTCSTQF